MTVADRITHIQGLFRQVHENDLSTEELCLFMSGFLPEYISVVYEAQSAKLAAQELKEIIPFGRWAAFLDANSEQHRSQIFVGFGWAIAENNAFDKIKLYAFASCDLWRISDGCGYYYGLFRRRESVRQQLLPTELPDSMVDGFDQGLGRSLWYLMQGSPERIRDLIAHFPLERHRSLWRGVGLAMAYVGGVEKDVLINLIQCVGPHISSLKCGVLLAIDGKKKAGIFEVDNMMCVMLRLSDLPEINYLSDFSAELKRIEAEFAQRADR